MYIAGYTINTVSFGGLALGIGMLVDSAIVILENIHRRREAGETLRIAALEGSREVSSAITASTTTTLVVFAPVIFIAGFAGVFFKEMAVVVCFALVCSLLIALTLVPAIAGNGRQRQLGQEATRARTSGVLGAIDRSYRRQLDAALRHPWRVIVAALALLGLSYGATRWIGSELMPESDEGQIEVNFELELGTPIERTIPFTKQLEARILNALRPGELDNVVTSAGPEAWWRPTGGHEGEVQLTLVSRSARSRSLDEIESAVRRAIADIPGMRAQIRRRSANLLLWIARRGEDRLAIEVRGHDMKQATRIAEQLESKMRRVPGVTFAKTARQVGNEERVILLDRARVAEQQLDTATVADAIEHYVLGKVTTRLRERGDEFDIRVLLSERDRRQIERLASLPVATSNGRSVSLGSIARIERRSGPASIYREGQERLIRVNAGLSGRPLSAVVADFKALAQAVELPEGLSVRVTGEQAEQQDTFSALSIGFGLALFLVFAVMAVQFESLRHPLVVMTAVPFALIGVVATLLLTGITFNMNSFLGCIVLVGIVVNNAIVMVDYINRLRREEGLTLDEALRQGSQRRLRPILMTTLTTALGMLPLALGIGEGSEIQTPLAATVIGGLLSSMVVTLFFVPSCYLLLERRREGRRVAAEARANGSSAD